MKTDNTDFQTDASLTGEPTSDNGSASELEREFVRPVNSYKWKGHELWPLCNGGEILFTQVTHVADSNLTLVLVWIFIYLKRGFPLFDEKGEQIGMREAFDPAEDFEGHLVPLCWDKVKFRGAFLRWANSLGPLTLEDKKAAVSLFDEMHSWARKSAVVPVPQLGQKKTTAKPQTKPPSSSTSSLKKAGASARRNVTSSGTSPSRS